MGKTTAADALAEKVAMTLTAKDAERFTQAHRCGDCGDGLLMPYKGRGSDGRPVHEIHCRTDATHRLFASREPNIRKLYDFKRGLVEVDIVTQKEVGTITPRLHADEAQMRERVKRAAGIGVFPGQTTSEQQLVLANVAVVYGLDPLMGELIPYQGRPFITIAGRRRLDAVAGHKPGIKFRFLTPDEDAGYKGAGVLEDGDLVQVCMLTLESGREVEAFGKVTLLEREARSNNGDRLRSPVVAANPIEMAQKRAERRAREMAYGPVPLPQGLTDPTAVLQEGDEEGVVEGTVLGIDDDPESVQAPADPIMEDDRGPVPPPSTLEDLQIGVAENGWSWEDFTAQTGVTKMPWEEWERLGGTVDQAWTEFLKRLGLSA